jgi:uncharacterized membrane protein (UPF0127 family)
MRRQSPEPGAAVALKDARGVVAVDSDGGKVVCERCVVAANFWTRLKGLLGKGMLPAGQGMLIHPAPSIHTFLMRFPIDAVFLSGHGAVLKVAPDVRPWRARSCRKAYAVLELPAGAADHARLAPGDQLVFTQAAS